MAELPLCRNPILGPHRVEHAAYVDRYGGFCHECANAGVPELMEIIADLRVEIETCSGSCRLPEDRTAPPATGAAVAARTETEPEDTHDRPPGAQRP